MRLFSTVVLLLFAGNTFSQQRVTIDVNTAMDNLFYTAGYYNVVQKSWLIHSGVGFGAFSFSWLGIEPEVVMNGSSLISPYNDVNTSPFPGHYLMAYQSRHKGVSLETGVGKFWELSAYHTIRVGATIKGYSINERLLGVYIYSADPEAQVQVKGYDKKHQNFSFGLEVFHAIRLTSRTTFFYGLKVPYFLPVRSLAYDPPSDKHPLAGIEPNMAMGLSFGIGKGNNPKQ